MLLGFKIQNFRSFDKLQHFSMIAGKTRNMPNHIYESNNLKILKFSAIYGANASGKSNLILAMNLGKRMILEGLDRLIPTQYFRIKKNNKNKPSYFEYELEIDNKLYSYGFEVNFETKTLISEWLIDMTKKTPVNIFERDIANKSITTDLKIKNNKVRNKLDVCFSDMENNNTVFLLNEMSRRIVMSNEQSKEFLPFIKVFSFFLKSFQTILPSQDKEIQINYFSKYKEDIKEILSRLGLDINELIETKSSLAEIKEKVLPEHFNILLEKIKTLQNENDSFELTIRVGKCIYILSQNSKEEPSVKAIKILHQNSDVLFETYEESDGTVRILELIDILLAQDKVFIIDEIDRSLHPALTIKFIQTFLDYLEKRNVQLIITTHESRLLDFNILRRDEIWFTEKKTSGATTLYSLEQFKEFARFDRKIDKAYLDGRFGAIPKFINTYGVTNENNDRK